MEYTVQRLAQLAGISSRTLRYYDEIEILKPARINSSGYRIYGHSEINRLQQILFYREMGIGLEDIKAIITADSFDEMSALLEHHQKLLEKRKQLDTLIENVSKTIQAKKGGTEMSDQEKFEGFKQKLIDDNEQKYGKEIREKYGEDRVNQSNQHFKNLSKEQYDEMSSLGTQINEQLVEAVQSGIEPGSEKGQEIAEMHKRWISLAWGQYSKEAHAGVAQMYVDDERFTAYYDEKQSGCAAFLRDAVHILIS
ncbi:MerR family transcriptional regulator [Desulfuribacillus stibiiarsenatis]|uniref:MerR family transcriptional regulator n=1 Tax=Desulfuribacillus stibiiarsenatis TaxID=1390249 RepID=A0A1E5L4R1_9FIRM|nr:MerR family transcriptional regulator [Desulfuribacillus stibiiarsenatis]OEH85096.1 MerR family transcriptional regulator [Desulfuribacillus stibiiarsenatis]